MWQEVNLFPESLRPKYDPINLRLAAVALVMVVLAYSVAAGALLWGRDSLKQEVADASEQKVMLEDQLEELNSLIEKQAVDPALERKEARLQQRIDDKRKLITLVKQEPTGTTLGYANVLESLAKHSLPGMRLTRFQVRRSREEIVLEGETLDPKLVPLFLDRLHGDAALKGSRFQVLDMNRDETNERLLHFSLRSHRGDDEDSENPQPKLIEPVNERVVSTAK